MSGPLGFSVSGGLEAREIVDCAVLAEELGYDSFWVAEGHGGDQFALAARELAVVAAHQAVHKALEVEQPVGLKRKFQKLADIAEALERLVHHCLDGR